MTFSACPREKEIAESLRNGHWPAGCDPELRAHGNNCPRCSDLVLVSQAFQRLRRGTENAAPLIPAGVLWWRAQLRRRNAAIERIGRPITAAQIFALSVNLLVAVGFLASQARHGVRWMSWFSGLPQFPSFHLETLWPAWSFASMKPDWSLTLLIPCAGALLLLSGVVLYLASERQ
jgi:hypothetical protein